MFLTDFSVVSAHVSLLDSGGPLTKIEEVPHAHDASHTPKYQLWLWNDEYETWEDVTDFCEYGSDVASLVEYTHYSFDGAFKLTEDGLPVFIRS